MAEERRLGERDERKVAVGEQRTKRRLKIYRTET